VKENQEDIDKEIQEVKVLKKKLKKLEEIIDKKNIEMLESNRQKYELGKEFENVFVERERLKVRLENLEGE
ncbi:723_t:CDS:1, partial [Scutellospora calospora]